MLLTYSTRPSTCSYGENKQYLRVRSILYGYNHHYLYLLYIIRMLLTLKNKKAISFKEAIKFAKSGKKMERLKLRKIK